MHGNTESCSGYKTRRYDNIRREVNFHPCMQIRLHRPRFATSPCHADRRITEESEKLAFVEKKGCLLSAVMAESTSYV